MQFPPRLQFQIRMSIDLQGEAQAYPFTREEGKKKTKADYA